MNVLVVGTGSFGRLRGAAFARRGCKVAFASRDLERARAATRALSGPEEHAGRELDLAWADAVFVATPPACHSEPTLQAARAGKPVLVEKPVEATLERARALEHDLGPAAALVSVAENYRFLPQVPLVQGASYLEAEVVLHRPRPPRGWRIDPALSGGGVLADMGVHYVHLLRLLLGELELERAEERARASSGADTAFFLEGKAGAARFSIDMSWVSWRRRSSVTLRAADRTVRFRVGKRHLWLVGFLGLPFDRKTLSDDVYGQEALHDDWLRAASEGRAAIPLAQGTSDLALVSAAYGLAHRGARG